MANARKRTAALGALNAQSAFLSARRGLNITVAGTFVGTVSLLRRAADGNTYPVTNAAGAAVTFTTPCSYNPANPMVEGDYALQMSAYTSGTANVVIEGW